MAILTFITTWNAFLWPLLVLTQTKSQTIPVGLCGLVGGSAIQYAETMASAVLGFLPLFAVFLLLQRQIAAGRRPHRHQVSQVRAMTRAVGGTAEEDGPQNA